MNVIEKIKDSPGWGVGWLMLSEVEFSKDDGEGKWGASWGPRTPRVRETSEAVWPNFPPNNSKRLAWREW